MRLRANSLLLSCLLPGLLALPPPAPAATPPRVMLATVYHAGIDVADYYVSEKLDGVRGHWDGHRLSTRSGLAIEPPAWFTAHWPAQPMDGELWIGRGRFEDASALVRAGAGDDGAWREARFMVFDLPADPGPFATRLRHMRALLDHAVIAGLRLFPQFRVQVAVVLDAWLARIIAAGGEGLVLQHRDAHYHAGRSEDLLKYKPYDDAEARVVGYTPGLGKYAGLTGALIVERPDGQRFRIGSGFSDAQRAHPPAIGSQVTYRYNGLTGNGTPRFARFLRVRELMPPPDPK
jgi:DNA ligase-1